MRTGKIDFARMALVSTYIQLNIGTKKYQLLIIIITISRLLYFSKTCLTFMDKNIYTPEFLRESDKGRIMPFS